MAIATQLYQLDQLDAELDRRRTVLAEVRRLIQRDPEIDDAETGLGDARSRESAVALEQRRLEGDLADLEARIKRDHTRIYGGQIIDPRELGSLEKELQQYQERREALEERLLGVMEQAETLQHQVITLNRRLNDLREQRESDRPTMEQEAEDMNNALTQLLADRESLAASLDARALNTYVRLRGASPHAVSHVSNGVCQWCRVSIPPKDIQHARAGALATCTNCARILYVG